MSGDLAREVDVVVVGASLAAAAAAKRLTDAGLEAVVLERKKLPRHKVCSGILAPRGHHFLIENFGPRPREILHEPTVRLRARAGEGDVDEVAAAVRELFGLTAPRDP